MSLAFKGRRSDLVTVIRTGEIGQAVAVVRGDVLRGWPGQSSEGLPMRNRLNVAIATVAALALGIALFAAVAFASSHGPQSGHGHHHGHGQSHHRHHGHGHGHKPPQQSLPPIDMSEAGELRLHRRAPATRSACSPSRTTTTPSPTRPARPAAASTSPTAGMPANAFGKHIDAGALQRLRRLQPRRRRSCSRSPASTPSPTCRRPAPRRSTTSAGTARATRRSS